MSRPFRFVACWVVLAAVVVPIVPRSLPSARGQSQARAAQAWTLDEAIARLALHPEDAYLQYVALQLARRSGRFEQVAEQLRAMSPNLSRVESLDLFNVFTGALAVQESLQLDTMSVATTGSSLPVSEASPLRDTAGPPPTTAARPSATPAARGRQTRATRSRRGRATRTRQAPKQPAPTIVADPVLIPVAPALSPGESLPDARVPVSSLSGPTVKSHPWAKMLAGRKPEISPLAMSVPEDFYFVEFRTLTKLVDALDAGDLWGTHLFNQAYREARTLDIGARLKRQLAIATNEKARPFYDLVVAEVGVTGSDPFAREGSDVTVLFRVKQPLLFKPQMDKYLDDAERASRGARRSTGQHLGVEYTHLTTPERELHVFAADPAPDLHLRSNSLAAFKRVIEAIRGKDEAGRAARRLGDTDEFAFIRTLLPPGHPDEDGLIYLSDPFIRRLVGPELKLTERRRMLCYNHLRMTGHAALLFRTERGRWPENLEELAQADASPGKFGEGALSCPDGGTYSLSADATNGVCSRHGHAQRLTPNIEIPVAEVSGAEANIYSAFVTDYNQYWRTFFDPIALRLKITPQQYKVETIVLPLIDNSIYTGLSTVLSGKPEELDALPVPRRNIFSAGFRFNKEQMLKETAGAEKDLRDEVRSFLDVPLDKQTRALAVEFLSKGVGNQFAFHVYDAHPTVDLNTAGLLALLVGGSLGRRGGSFSTAGFEPLIGLSLASLTTPVYVSLPVKDAQTVDRFLEHLDRILAVESRKLRRGGWFGVEPDFFEFPLGNGQTARGYGIRFGPAKFRFFWARVGGGLYLASKPFILEDLAAAQAPPPPTPAQAGAEGHAMARVRASSWNEVLPDYRLSWAESEREACLNNLGALSSVARALSARAPGQAAGAAETGEALDKSALELADRLHAVHFFCPEAGAYRVAPDGKSVSCSVHGTASEPRQPPAPTERSAAGKLMGTLNDMTATLTFMEDGLHATVVVNRK